MLVARRALTTLGTFTFTGRSLMGDNLSNIIPTHISLEQIHTNNAAIFGTSRTIPQRGANKAPTNEGNHSYELRPVS